MTPEIIVKPDPISVRIKGEWWDEHYSRDPKTGLLILEHRSAIKLNTKMDDVAFLVAALMANDTSTITGGILQHAQGRGDGMWTTSPPAVDTTDSTLLDEIDRKEPTSIVFLDGADLPTTTRTKVIRVRTTYLEPDLAGEDIREQALFGGDATDSIDTGVIVNVIRHAPISKSGASILTRSIKLTFS